VNIILTRYGSTPMGTFGELVCDDFHCYTVEREWRDNKPFVSCIPEGTYKLVKHSSPKYGWTYALVGDGVYQYEDSLGGRYGILIHPANTHSQLQGCIALGSFLGFHDGEWAVMNSRRTVNRFLSRIEHESPTLIVRWQQCGE